MDNFLERPELIGKLSRPEIGKLFAQVRVLEGAVFARLLTGDVVQPASAAAPSPSTAPAAPCMLTRLQVAKRIAVSKITISRMVARKTFPAPVRDGRLLRWRESEVAEWERRA